MRVFHNYLAATLVCFAGVLALGCENSNEPVVPVTGALEIKVLTAGADIDLDADGYTASVDGGPVWTIGVGESVTISGLLPGNHLIRLGGLAWNCTVVSPNPSAVRVTTAYAATPVSFSVSCRPKDGSGEWDY